MSRRNYKSLTIPEGLYHELEKFVADSGGYYISVSEMVRQALRQYLKTRQETEPL
jgi:metal-responsive CopG/Arc/MetJ family transcriptional regulator